MPTTIPPASPRVALCKPRHSGPLSRGQRALGADLAWRVAEDYATTLLAAYEDRRWSSPPS
ncbi:hypothetical protein [Streptomyces sp. NPDC001594]|uniref:hypothetical protein n=1 Tax=Streptomyces sp. NPDC001594 TaxID=3364590 RepID=UPI0036AF66FB